MPSLFSRVLAGELPSEIVYADDVCGVFLSIAPVAPGHALVVPRREVDAWLEAEDGLLTHLTLVARTVGRGQQAAFGCPRVGLLIAGFEVLHLHLHVLPATDMAALDITRAVPVDPAELVAPGRALRSALRAAGTAGVPGD